MENCSRLNYGYACQNTNENILENSSSGGVFYSMAKQFVENGGVVFGAAFKSDFSVELIYAENLKDVKPLMTSKYVQSGIGESFHTAKAFLNNGRNVLFCGAPCQIYGLKTYLEKSYVNLTTVEFICHGMPQKQIWKNYLDYLKRQGTIEHINFRDKTEGWHSYSLNVKYEGGRSYRKNFHQDLYLRGFLTDLYLLPSCYKCQFKGINRAADITIGDLWGAENLLPEAISYDKGVSLVWVHTETGDKLWKQIYDSMCTFEIDIEKALLYNPALLKSAIRPQTSDIFYELLNEQIDFYKAMEMCVHAAEYRKLHPWIEDIDTWSYFQALRKDHSICEAAEIALYAKHSIAVVGPWSNKNHGGALTYFALYKELTRQGHFPIMIAQPQDSPVPPDVEHCKYDQIPYPEYALAPIMSSMGEMSKLNEICDTFIVGSDQWYNQNLAYGIQEYTNLSWVYATKNKAAYAASFGYDYYTGNEYQRGKLAYFLKKFDRFSVREQSGVTLADKSFDVHAEWVLDPVFLCNQNTYDELTKKTVLPFLFSPYLFVYMLDVDDEKNTVLKNCGEYLNLSVHAVVDSNYTETNHPIEWTIDTVYGASHELWLEHIKKSEYVITDSFHGLCFALIYHKPFIAIVNSKRGSTRFETLVDLLGIEAHIVNDVSEILNLLKLEIKPDYERIDALLKMKINESRDVLLNISSLERKTSGSLDIYDILNSANLQYDHLEEKILEVDKNWFHATQQLFSFVSKQNDEIAKIDQLYWQQTRELHEKDTIQDDYISKMDKVYWDITRQLFATVADHEKLLQELYKLVSERPK